MQSNGAAGDGLFGPPRASEGTAMSESRVKRGLKKLWFIVRWVFTGRDRIM